MKMNFPKKKSERVKGERYTYVAGRSQNCFSFNTSLGLVPVNHKGYKSLAFINKWHRTYKTCEIVSYSEALALMSYLASYINAVKPTEATILMASTKAHCSGIVRDQQRMLAQVMDEESDA